LCKCYLNSIRRGVLQEVSFRDGDIHGPSQGRVAWASKNGRRSCGTATDCCALLRPRYDKGRARSSCSDRVGTGALLGSSHCSVTVTSGLPLGRRRHDAARCGTRECPAAGDGEGRNRHGLAAPLPAKELWVQRGRTRRGTEALPARRTQALAEAGGPPLRFHDLRHTTASLLMMAGANPAAVQRILGHSSPAITTGIYGHLAPSYLLAEADRLSFGLKPTPVIEKPMGACLRVANLPSFVPQLSPNLRDGKKELGAGANQPNIPSAFPARSTGLEPVTSGVTGRRSNQLN